MEESLKINVNEYQGFPVLSLEGELDPIFLERIEQVIKDIEFAPLIIVDLTKLNYLCSEGIKWLLTWRSKHCGMILLIALSENTRRILEITGLLPFFPTFNDLESSYRAVDALVKITQT